MLMGNWEETVTLRSVRPCDAYNLKSSMVRVELFPMMNRVLITRLGENYQLVLDYKATVWLHTVTFFLLEVCTCKPLVEGFSAYLNQPEKHIQCYHCKLFTNTLILCLLCLVPISLVSYALCFTIRIRCLILTDALCHFTPSIKCLIYMLLGYDLCQRTCDFLGHSIERIWNTLHKHTG